MATRKQVTWTGESGKKYDFGIWTLAEAETLDPGQKGNYIYTFLTVDRLWCPVYIGQGDLAERADLDKHQQGWCITRKGATHFHCHLEARKQDRRDEEVDLLGRFTNAYVPDGCNIREGG